MANKTSLNFPKKTFIIVAILSLGASMGLYVLGQNTNYQQNASQDINLNSANDITTTINADGTMGPATAMGNYATTLPSSSQGTLAFKIIDPPQGTGNGNTYGQDKKQNTYPTQASTSQYYAVSPSAGKVNIDSPFTSLILKVKKVEVHLAQLANPGKPEPTQASDRLYPSPKNRAPYDKLTGADKWETLILDESMSYVDLIDLAKTGNEQELGLTQLAEGKYTQIRLYIESATGKLQDGTDVTITIPQKSSVVKIVRPFTIAVGEKTTVIVDFSAEKSVRKVGNNYILQPVVTRFITDK